VVTTVTIATVVEGHGEVEAVPVLLRRIVADVAPGLYINVPRPYRVGRHALVRPGGLEDVVRTQGDRVTSGGGVLVLIDADDDCPAELAPQLLDRALAARPDRRIALVLANREYEAWFLAAAQSFAGQRGFPDMLEPPGKPEGVRGAKEWLSGKRPGRPYKETADQAALTQRFDMKAARKQSPSFDKLWRDVERLISE
jgi:Domain of unknown function (DUF4276)